MNHDQDHQPPASTRQAVPNTPGTTGTAQPATAGPVEITIGYTRPARGYLPAHDEYRPHATQSTLTFTVTNLPALTPVEVADAVRRATCPHVREPAGPGGRPVPDALAAYTAQLHPQKRPRPLAIGDTVTVNNTMLANEDVGFVTFTHDRQGRLWHLVEGIRVQIAQAAADGGCTWHVRRLDTGEWLTENGPRDQPPEPDELADLVRRSHPDWWICPECGWRADANRDIDIVDDHIRRDCLVMYPPDD